MASAGRAELVITARWSQAGSAELASWLPTATREITDFLGNPNTAHSAVPISFILPLFFYPSSQLVCLLLVFVALWVIPRCGARLGRCWEAPGCEPVPGRPGAGPLRQRFILYSRKVQVAERPSTVNRLSSTEL